MGPEEKEEEEEEKERQRQKNIVAPRIRIRRFIRSVVVAERGTIARGRGDMFRGRRTEELRLLGNSLAHSRYRVGT